MSQSSEIDVLSLSALFKGEFSIDWAQDLTGLRASSILLALDEGVERFWITRQTPDQFIFSDKKKQQQLTDSLSEQQRRHWHGRIADLLTLQVATDAGIRLELAHHLLNTTQDFTNCQALIQTGDALYRAFHHQDALQCFTQAINNLSAMTGDEADECFVEAVYLYCRIFTGEQKYDWITSAIDAALVRAERLGFHLKKPLLIMHMAKYKWFSGHHTSAINTFNQGWSIAQMEGNPVVLRQALTLRMFFLWWQGRYQELVDIYEQDRPELIRYPRSKTPILVSCMLGSSYVHCGQVTQGVGLLNSLYDQCRKLEQHSSMTEVACALGASFIDIGRADDAIAILEKTMAEQISDLTPYTKSAIHNTLALAFGEKADIAGALRELKSAVTIASHSAGLGPQGLPGTCKYLWPVALSLDDGELANATGLDLGKIIHVGIKGRSIHEKGMAYFLKALLLQKGHQPAKEIAEMLEKSIRWIKESGHVIHLARIRLVLARVYLEMGDDDRARVIVRQATEVLAPINDSLIPDDLAGLIEDTPRHVNLLDSIIKLSNEIAGIRDYRELVQRILSTINQITGAERGGLFTIKGEPVGLELKAATVLTVEDVEHESFKPAWTLIRKTVSSGESQLMVMTEPAQTNLLGDRRRRIRSCFCIPMVLRNELIGVLYHDNRLMASRVTNADLASLVYFASQAAIAIDNAQAYEEIHLLNQQLKKEKDYYVEQHLQSSQYDGFVGGSPTIQQTFSQVEQVADTDSTVLILGETGVGKELVAHAIHQSSSRKSGSFIRVDCNSLSESLIYSEMFGHEKGAFTGAIKQHTGRFELADGGTLFLDEIGNIPMDVQTRLLRVLETKEFQRVGGTETIRSDFRLLTATNENLAELVRAGRFREDLYYRLNVYPITVPPLRDRIEDIPVLAHVFLKSLGVSTRKTVTKIAKSSMEKLQQYTWPGNVRELKNVIERGVLLSSGSYLRIPDLTSTNTLSSQYADDMTLTEVERQHIIKMLKRTKGKIHGKGGAAERLGIHHNTLRSRMKKLGIVRNAEAKTYVQSE